MAADVLIPAFRQATRVRGAFGWFTAGWIHSLAPGLAEYLRRDDVETIEFTIAPALFPTERQAIERAIYTPAEVAARIETEILKAAHPDAGALANHAVECLAWMVAKNRMTLSIAIPLPQANYHPKMWLFTDGRDSIAVRGSANATGRAHEYAVEHMDVDCSWIRTSAERVKSAEEMVTDWAVGCDPVLERTVPLPLALRERLLKLAPTQPPTPLDYSRAATHSNSPKPAAARKSSSIFAIPTQLEWQTGPYRHQGEAVAAWEAAGRRGILAMATGAGKTISSLICAYRARQEHDGPFLLIVSAPTTALTLQWNTECAKFGLKPLNPSPGTATGRSTLGNALRRLKSGGARAIECFVVTNNTLNDPSFRKLLEHAQQTVAGLAEMLIADEVHTLGTPSFLNDTPDFLNLRLGLSATPVRQYDEDGTQELLSYFGDTVYEFGLDKAIGFCLTPYDYYFDVVYLDDDELARFRDLSEKISRRVGASGKFDPRDEILRTWLIRRREITENAQGKIQVLRQLLQANERPRHLLVYTTSKNPLQIDAAAEVLDERHIVYARVTQVESRNKAKLGRILQSFSDGDIEVLLAKKVLDEGVDIPQAREAILLASSTVEREWIQRRGRILRRAPGKMYATIHDMIALPPPLQVRYEDSVLNTISRELDRVRSFGRYARNAHEVLAAIRKVHGAYFD
ncbi:DEAD/DEAH box helicase family protein [Sphaerisporangium perillae]|uniref:DEAD/DEAH box helicase family protein n=1 Tax=Sphaerisporangium perillae TaxID=2935860 RepID=UPI00200C0DDC|nr:DEAD/DEAH box helicase family protein [Sphaerisporangium perillae]